MKYLLLLLFVATKFNSLLGNITIDSPVNNGVYQRDENGFSKIAIYGKLDNNKIDKIEYLLTDYQLNEAENTKWIEIKNLKIDSLYFGEISVYQGWYKFKIRYWAANKIVEEKSLERVGVGEVFVIVGQSNAAGDPNTGITDANDERVITLNNYYLEFNRPLDIKPTFSKITRDGYIGPSGRTAWLWGKLGDKLVDRLQVPVLFFNASFNGSSISQWYKSQKDVENNLNEYSAPYGTVYNTILRFGNEFGIRSILWFQGEADNFNGMGSSQYFIELKAFIENIRINTKKPKLGFVIARTSYGLGKYGPNIIQAQNWIIGSTPNTFAGPESDLIIGKENRSDDLHYSGQGLYTIAEAWNQSLTDDFFKYCEKTAPIPETVKYRNPTFNHYYNDKCYSTFIKFNTYTDSTLQVKWNYELNTDANKTKIITKKGDYWYRFENESFKSINSKSLYVEFDIQPEAPTINFQKKEIYCTGDTVVLSSNEKNDLVWNNNLTNSTYTVKNTGKYSLKKRSGNDCFSKESIVDFTFTKPLPKLVLNKVNNIYAFCEKDSTLITTTDGLNNLNWSTGSNNNKIYLKTSGKYWVNYKNNNGCPTENTEFEIKVNKNPTKPTIIRENGESIKAVSDGEKYYWFKNNQPLAEISNKLSTYESGTYTSYSEKKYQVSNNENLVCKSEISDAFQLIILDNEKNNLGIKLGPNPIIDHILQLKLPNTTQNIGLKLYDNSGKILLDKNMKNYETQFEFPKNIKSGNYIIQFTIGKNRFVEKIHLW